MKIRHIREPREFAEILKNGKKKRAKTLCFYSQRVSENEGPAGVGLIVAKVLAPKAVKRNYIRRVVYAFFTEEKTGVTRMARVVVRLSRDVRSEKNKALGAEIREELAAFTKAMRKTT